MPNLRIVPPVEPDPAQAVLERLKKVPRLAGMLQCNRCGGRTVMSTWSGSEINKAGRYKAGTPVDDKVCYHCHMQGIWTPMIPDSPKIAKPPKPRRTKPKAVK